MGIQNYMYILLGFFHWFSSIFVFKLNSVLFSSLLYNYILCSKGVYEKLILEYNKYICVYVYTRNKYTFLSQYMYIYHKCNLAYTYKIYKVSFHARSII